MVRLHKTCSSCIGPALGCLLSLQLLTKMTIWPEIWDDDVPFSQSHSYSWTGHLQFQASGWEKNLFFKEYHWCLYLLRRQRLKKKQLVGLVQPSACTLLSGRTDVMQQRGRWWRQHRGLEAASLRTLRFTTRCTKRATRIVKCSTSHRDSSLKSSLYKEAVDFLGQDYHSDKFF